MGQEYSLKELIIFVMLSRKGRGRNFVPLMFLIFVILLVLLSLQEMSDALPKLQLAILMIISIFVQSVGTWETFQIGVPCQTTQSMLIHMIILVM